MHITQSSVISADHTQTIISVDNLSFAYGSNSVLKDVSFQVHKGDYLGIIGPNGGGKTTLLKCMVGLLKPTHGSIKLYGKPLTGFSDWSKIGYVSQRVVQFDKNFPATVEEVVAMGRFARLGLFKFPGSYDTHAVQEALDRVGMRSYAKRLIGDLSGGQQQRVFIARALVGEPEVVFLDEPTTGVDVNSQEQFYVLLRKLNRELQLTIILLTHDLSSLIHEATEVAYVEQKLLYYGTSEQFMQTDFVHHTHPDKGLDEERK